MPPSKTQQLLQMLQSEPLDSFLNYALALEYAKENSIEKAIELIEAIIVRDPDYIGCYYQLGKMYEQTSNFEKAVDAYNRGIAIAKKQNNRKTLGELNEAISMLE